MGRVSASPGGPEALSIGTGLAQQTGTILANGADHIGFTLATSLMSDDEVVLNSSASPKRLPATRLRSLFTAGSGVQIDDSGVISVTITSDGGTGVAGPTGDTGAQGPAGQGFTFRGPWQANVSYIAYDVVTNGGQTYLAVVAVPAASAFSASSWALIAAQGAPGITGATGAIGPAGPTSVASASNLGAIKSGLGLTIAVDGTLSVGNVSLSSIAQGSATIGQLLGWSGTAWAPTTPGLGVSYTGLAPVSVSSGVISLSQNNATAGQVLTWSGTAWAPTTPTLAGTYTGAAPVSVSSGVIGLSQNNALVGQVLTWTGIAWMPQAPAASGVALGTAIPLADGLASAGTATAASHEDHRHPTDLTRASITSPVFTGSITLPSWTTTTRPASPTPGMEGYATDTARRETYTAAGWVQYVRTSDLPVATGQLLGGSTVAGVVAPISIGSGLSLVGGTLSAASTASAPTISGLSIDGNTITASSASPYQMAATDRVVDVNKTIGAPTKVMLPSNPNLWVEYIVIDGRGDASINNITLSLAQGGTINGQSNFVMNANNDAITLRAVNATTWRIS